MLAGSFALSPGVPEVLVRIADPSLEASIDIALGGAERSRLLFQKDPELVWAPRPTPREFTAAPRFQRAFPGD